MNRKELSGFKIFLIIAGVIFVLIVIISASENTLPNTTSQSGMLDTNIQANGVPTSGMIAAGPSVIPTVLTDQEYIIQLNNNVIPFIHEVGVMMNNVSTYIANKDYSNAVISIRQVQIELKTTKQELDKFSNQVPVDMSQVNDLVNKWVDTNLRGCNLSISGINNMDVATLQEADNLFATATGYIEQATALINQWSNNNHF